MLYVPDGEMTEAEKVCYDAGWLTPLQGATLREALESVCSQLVVQMEWIDNHNTSFRDSGEYMGDTSIAREALAEAKAALGIVSATDREAQSK